MKKKERHHHYLDLASKILSNSLPCLCPIVSNTIELVSTRRWATERRLVTDGEWAAHWLPAMVRPPYECWICDQILWRIHDLLPPPWNPRSQFCIHPRKRICIVSPLSLSPPQESLSAKLVTKSKLRERANQDLQTELSHFLKEIRSSQLVIESKLKKQLHIQSNSIPDLL